jgi:hypothetical protein
MEPKFQSSFIPKGPLAASSSISSSPVRSRGLFSTVATIIFTLSVILSIGVFGYKHYLNYRIDKMGADLEAARQEVESDITHELIRLDSRIVSTRNLLSNHVVVGPLFDFLEGSTLRSVRFNDFKFSNTSKGIELTMTGQARGYSSLALQADVFNRSVYLKNPIFSNLDLDDEGNVIFSFKANIDPTLVAYRRVVEREVVPATIVTPTVTTPATSTSTSTPRGTATSTRN